MNSHIRNCQNIDKIVTFCISEEEAKQKLAWELAKCDQVPIDIFENLSIMVAKAYHPLWVFRGRFKVPWSCLKIVRNKNFHIRNINPERSTDYYPVNGVAIGDFELAISATTKDNLFFEESVVGSEECSLKVEDGVIQYDLDISSEEAWGNKKTQQHIERIARKELDGQTPHEYTDLNCYVEYLNKESYSVLYPIMNMTYHYKGRKYSCKIDGYGNFLKFDHPIENGHYNTESIDDIELKKPISMSKFGWTCFGLFALNLVLVIWSLESKIPVMVALCVLMLVLPIVWAWKMSNRRDKGKAASVIIHNSYNKVKGKYQRNFHQQRMQELANANIPLLKLYREEMQKNGKDVSLFVAEYSEKANEYNKMIKRDEMKMKTYYAVMFLITGLVVISLLIHYLNTHSL